MSTELEIMPAGEEGEGASVAATGAPGGISDAIVHEEYIAPTKANSDEYADMGDEVDVDEVCCPELYVVLVDAVSRRRCRQSLQMRNFRRTFVQRNLKMRKKVRSYRRGGTI
jgi:hypothetical protein